MLFTGREVRIGKNCARGLEYGPRAVLKTMSYRKHGVRIESCFKETALKDVEGSIKLSRYR